MQHLRWIPILLLMTLLGCGSSSDPGDISCGSACGGGDANSGGSPPIGGSGGQSDGSGGKDHAGGGAPGTETQACAAPVALCDSSAADHVVGTGTPASCTGAALKEAVEQGGIVTFDCGAEKATITLDQGITVRSDADTIVDGKGKIALDGAGAVRHFTMEGTDWQKNEHKLVLQRLTIRNGSAPKGEYFPPTNGKPACSYGYKEGSGGAVFVRDGVLEVLDSEFLDNEAALIGPDVGGGAIYAMGVRRLLISGSSFKGNQAANGGAIGMLFANPVIVNSVFEDNSAVGVGMNTAGYVECTEFSLEQGGAGGLSGAVYFDGMNDDDFVYHICGSVFRNNRANELAGALFRTPNITTRQMKIESCLFENNTARMGAVSFIKQNELTVIDSTFMGNRAGVLVDGTETGGPFGGLWLNESSLDMINSTFYDNAPSGLDVDGDGQGERILNSMKTAV